jgi:hypothetical protein
VPRPSHKLSEVYVSQLRRFDRARANVESLLLSGHVSPDDASLFYEGIFLRTVTTLEGLLEDLFVGLLAGSITPSRTVHARVTFRSHRVAREVMLSGRAYVDWLPYHHTEKRAEAFFRGGLPFCNLDKNDKKQLDQIIVIRNAVAHQSRTALRKFENEVIGTTPLLPAERTPAGYLRSVFRTAPAQTRYEDIANTCATLARKVCN